MPEWVLEGGSFAIPKPSTPRLAQALRARVGPRSGPPCFKLPPTTVGAISFAVSRQNLAPSHPLEAIKSYKTSPTVLGIPKFPAGQENFSNRSCFSATKITRGRSCETPKSDAFSKCQSDRYP